MIIEQGLLLASYFAVALAIFIILNTFLMNVSERRRQLAILRAVGRHAVADRRHAAGRGAGHGGSGDRAGLPARRRRRLPADGRDHADRTSPRRPPVIFNPSAFILAGVLGPQRGRPGCVVPASVDHADLSAGGHATAGGQGRRRMPPRGSPIAGLVLALVTGGLVVVVRPRLDPAGPLHPRLVVLHGVVRAADPVADRPAGPQRSPGCLAQCCGWKGRLAHRQVRRRPVRTALTAGVLYMAVAVGVGLGTTIINNVDDVPQLVPADDRRRLLPPRHDPRYGHRRRPSRCRRSWATTSGKSPASPTSTPCSSSTSMPAEHRPSSWSPRIHRADDLPLDLYQGDPAKVRRRLLQGEVVVGTVLAQRAGVEAGRRDHDLNTRQGDKIFRIAALTIDYMVGGYMSTCSRSLAERAVRHRRGRRLPGQGGRPTPGPAVRGRSEKLWPRSNGLMLHSFAELSQHAQTRSSSAWSAACGESWCWASSWRRSASPTR